MALWAAIFPADVVKSRMQVSERSSQGSFIEHMVKIAKEEGIGALYKVGASQGLGQSGRANDRETKYIIER